MKCGAKRIVNKDFLCVNNEKMKRTITIFCFGLLIMFSNSCASQTQWERNFTIHGEFQKYFDKCGVDGSFAIFDNNSQEWILSDTVSVKKQSLPASTFKIINLLIALETKTIRDENEVVKWVGATDTIKYGYRPEIYHDMSVKEAFEVSAGWVFIELAKRIGKKNYKKYLTACKYGNLNLSESDDDFWNYGNFAISPIEQVEFIKNLYKQKLPFSSRTIEIVKQVMITEKTVEFVTRGKTGWTRANGQNTGWWVGYIETSDNNYFFATRLMQDRKNKREDFGNCRKEITKKIFYDLGFLKSASTITARENELLNSVDHIPVVVNDLEKVIHLFKNKLHFKIKEGRVHEGVKNCFIKFRDGTYIEFIEPTDRSKPIGNYYANLLKKRQGATAMAIATQHGGLVKKMLTERSIQFSTDSNKIWKTYEPHNAGLFFIEYADTKWKENPSNTAHINTASSLHSTYILCDDIEEETKKYKQLGFSEKEKGNYLQTPSVLLKAGKSSLYLLDGKKSKNLNLIRGSNVLKGICGLEIKVKSLSTFNKLVSQQENVIKETSSTIMYLKGYNIFLAFTE